MTFFVAFWVWRCEHFLLFEVTDEPMVLQGATNTHDKHTNTPLILQLGILLVLYVHKNLGSQTVVNLRITFSDHQTSKLGL